MFHHLAGCSAARLARNCSLKVGNEYVMLDARQLFWDVIYDAHMYTLGQRPICSIISISNMCFRFKLQYECK